jgi:hypothetical protein
MLFGIRADARAVFKPGKNFGLSDESSVIAVQPWQDDACARFV